MLGEYVAIRTAWAGYPVAWFAPTYKLLQDVWRELNDMLADHIATSSVTERRIKLRTGGVIEFWSLDSGDAGRGRKYANVIIDEAAMVPNLEYEWQASIRPTLTDYRGGAWFLSTPKGRNGFWLLFQNGYDNLQPDWVSWCMPTETNPYIDDDEIAAAKESLPERIFQQEYLAEFLEDSVVFRRITECAIAKPLADPVEGQRYVVGVDWGKREDFTVAVVMDLLRQEMVYMDRFNQIDYQMQLGRLQQLYRRWKPEQFVMEVNGVGDPLVDQLRAAGLPIRSFVTTNRSKQHMIEALMVGFEQQRIKIINDPVLVGELQAFEAVQLANGVRYQAPEGFHDDCVMALGLAWDAAKMDTMIRQIGKARIIA